MLQIKGIKLCYLHKPYLVSVACDGHVFDHFQAISLNTSNSIMRSVIEETWQRRRVDTYSSQVAALTANSRMSH
jgi:hypothetical protein